MKTIAALLLLLPGVVFAQTYPSPTFSALTLQTALAESSGGTGTATASGTALDNITGFSGTGFLTRTGAGGYAFQSLTNGITLGNLAQAAANTVLANASGSTANVAAFAMPSCSSSVSALTWTGGTGFGCNTSLITASTAASTYAPIASPIFTGTPAAPTATAGTATTQLATTAFVTTSPTINQPNLVGVTNGSSAPAGSIGQPITSNVPSGSAVSLTSNTPVNITSLPLTAGDWDVWGNCWTNPAGSTIQVLTICAISTASGAFPASPGAGGMTQLPATLSTGSAIGIPAGTAMFNVASTTTVYLVMMSQFSTSTNTGYGFLAARRRH